MSAILNHHQDRSADKMRGYKTLRGPLATVLICIQCKHTETSPAGMRSLYAMAGLHSKMRAHMKAEHGVSQ